MLQFRVAIIGGGILGCSIAYFLSSKLPKGSVALIEQEAGLAYHASSRNTGKVHAPFLYDPVKKRLFARAAYLGFQMWKEFAAQKALPFRDDGVLEVATDRNGIQVLLKYARWGEANGLNADELRFLDGSEVQKIEPQVVCEAALYCTRDASVDYGAFTKNLAEDSQRFGARILLGRRVVNVLPVGSNLNLSFEDGNVINTQFLVNAAGGSSLETARLMSLAREYSALYFRGEYWKAPDEYRKLTKRSIYSVPKHSEYPFLDPHWVVRANGEVEVGPNAVPVSGPDAYDWSRTLRGLPSFAFEMIRSAALRVFLDSEFLSLAMGEWESSLLKGAMIGRVREFLPAVDPQAFTQRGFSGIRSVLLDARSKFLDDAVILRSENSLHILNYNSPGATGALPMAAMIASNVLERLGPSPVTAFKGLWDPAVVSAEMQVGSTL